MSGGTPGRWNLIVDVALCVNCNNCVLATKDEYDGNEFEGYAAPRERHGHEWFSVDRHVRGSGTQVDVTYVPRTCNHCDDAPCVRAGGGAVRKRDDGIVIIDPMRAKGRRDLVASCPYGAIGWNVKAQLPQHWIFDAHLLDAGWQAPRCVQACPTGALRAVRLEDAAMAALAAAEGLEPLRPELNTRPRVHSRNLGRVRDVFVGGNVCVTAADGREDNVEGARVEVWLDGAAAPAGSAGTDAFGDFRIDGLRRGAAFRLRVTLAGAGTAECGGTLATSVDVGVLRLG